MKFGIPTNKNFLAPYSWERRRPAGESQGFAPGNTPARRWRSQVLHSRESAFTLAEVLAALLFLAIVIPAAVEALHLASLAGVVAARKGAAARVADRILSESLVLTNWNTGTQNGTVTEGAQEFRWTLTSQNWPVDAMELITAEVKYSAQGRDYSVKLCTLANPLTLSTTMGSQQ
jgi:type II secretory pathway pseudopilin PulG